MIKPLLLSFLAKLPALFSEFTFLFKKLKFNGLEISYLVSLKCKFVFWFTSTLSRTVRAERSLGWRQAQKRDISSVMLGFVDGYCDVWEVV